MICAIVLSVVAVGAPAARAATTTVQPSPAEARTFATTNGGWSSAVDYNGLVCIPGVTCPSANPSFQTTNGAGGSGDGYLRHSFGTLLGVLSTTTISWTSPAFTAPSSTDAVNLSLSVRPQIASLLAIGSVQLKAWIVDSVTSAATPVATIPLTAASSSFGAVQATVPTSAFTAGNSYKLRIGALLTTNVSAVTSGNVDMDNIALTFADVDLPSGLTAAVPASGPTRVAGSVDPHGMATAVTVDYGTTASYGTTSSAVNVTGTGSQPYSVPLTGLTPGATYHYRVTAENTDGSVSTTDDTFVAPSLPSDAAPTAVTGADNSRNRTVTFARAADVTTATVEILGAGATVLDSVDDTDADGSVAITLPNSDGTYDLRVVRESDAGLTSTSATVPALLDRSAPSLSGLDLTVTPELSTATQRSITFTRPSDALTVSAQVIDAANANVGSPVTVNAGTANVQLGSSDGDYRVRLTLTDAAGNSASMISDPVTLDTTAPNAGPAPTVDGDGNARNRTVIFTRDSSTDAAEIELLDASNTIIQTVAVPTGASGAIQLPDADGNYAIRVKQTDAAGNSARSPQTAVALDRVAPEAPTAPTAAGTPDALDVVFDRASDAATVDVEVRAATGELMATIHVPTGNHATVVLPDAEGEYEITVVQTDHAGNSTTTPPLKVTRKRAETEPQPQPQTPTPSQPQAETSNRPSP
ncbi:MAG: fibronectin type III domain-containing protein, partial [Solirubrobacterales bacterium]